jgi:hypothetical protein
MPINITPLTLDQGAAELKYCDSYSRLPTLLNIAWRMDNSDWLTLLGDMWSICDNLGLYIDDWFDTPFGDRQEDCPIVEMMTPDELAAYEALPSICTVYRGCYKINKRGLSWSLSRQVAERFPTLNRYCQQDQPLLVKAVVKKEKIAAVKLDRNETEIITFWPKHISTSYIRIQKG